MFTDVVNVLQHGVLYFQNTTLFHGTRRNVITQETNRRILGKSKMLRIHYVRVLNTELYSKRTISVESTDKNTFTPLNKLPPAPHQFSRNSQTQNGIARRSCVPNLIKIGHEMLIIHVKVHSCSPVK